MKTVWKYVVLGLVVISVCVVSLRHLVFEDRRITSVDTVRSLSNGAVVAFYNNNSYHIKLLNDSGAVTKAMSVDVISGDSRMSVADIAVGENGDIFMLCDYYDIKTGRYLSQELVMYNINKSFAKKLQAHKLPNEEYRFKLLSLGASLTLFGVDEAEENMLRESYEPATIAGKTIQKKNSRSYTLAKGEGISLAAIAGGSVAYMTRSGKIFLTGENGECVEKYPARSLDKLMYPSFIAARDEEGIYLGEQESGDLMTLELASGEATVLKGGTEPFSGAASITPRDIAYMDFVSEEQFAAVAKSSDNSYRILVSTSFGVYQTAELSEGIISRIFGYILEFILYLLVLLTLLGVCILLKECFKNGRSILVKLMAASIPLLLLAMTVFGLFSYSTYENSVRQSIRKQAIDEGNLLTALFGTESFSEVEFPYDYTSEAYRYLDAQMKTREVYTRAAYFERNDLYIGIDRNTPCFYPFDTLMNKEAYRLHREAAYTGEVQTGIIEDKNGRRLVAVTPIGGVSGTTVYLLETGVPEEELKQYTVPFAMSYIGISAGFLIGIGALLTLLFLRVLKPLSDIRRGMEEFATGNRTVRLENTTKDELSDIIRVFNKLSNDVDTQIYHLKQMGETYYKFIPQNSYKLLGEDGIEDLTLGSHIQSTFQIAAIQLFLNNNSLTLMQEQDFINRFFNIVNEAASRSGSVLVTDSANLCRINLVCPKGNAVDTALSILTETDSLNLTLPVQIQLEPIIAVHNARAFYGVLGGETRFVPALISSEMKMLSSKIEALRVFSCRLLVTGAAVEAIGEAGFSNRFIGYAEENRDSRYRLFDFYDCLPQDQVRLLEDTRQAFDKAMELYLEGRYYDAKNLFASIIRDNQYDNVSRYYIFKCESSLNEAK